MSDSKEKALKMKQALDRQFYQKGIAVAVISGICYGLGNVDDGYAVCVYCDVYHWRVGQYDDVFFQCAYQYQPCCDTRKAYRLFSEHLHKAGAKSHAPRAIEWTTGRDGVCDCTAKGRVDCDSNYRTLSGNWCYFSTHALQAALGSTYYTGDCCLFLCKCDDCR